MSMIEPVSFAAWRAGNLDGPVHRLDVEVEGEIPVVLGTTEHAACLGADRQRS
jgi:hypothetical protein